MRNFVLVSLSRLIATKFGGMLTVGAMRAKLAMSNISHKHALVPGSYILKIETSNRICFAIDQSVREDCDDPSAVPRRISALS